MNLQTLSNQSAKKAYFVQAYTAEPKTLPTPSVSIGRLNLVVSDLEAALAFYCDLLGFEVIFYGPEQGLPKVLLCAGNSLQILLTFAEHQTFRHATQGSLAFAYPNRFELTKAVQRIYERGYPMEDAQDQGASVSVYLRDPDGNRVELYYDRSDKSRWGDARKPFDPYQLLEDLSEVLPQPKRAWVLG